MRGAIRVGSVPVAGVTPAMIRRYDRRARDLRAAAQAALLCHLFRAPLHAAATLAVLAVRGRCQKQRPLPEFLR